MSTVDDGRPQMPAGKPGAGGGGFKKLWAQHKPEVIGGSIAAVGGLAYVLHRKGAASTPAGGTATATPAAPAGADTTGNDAGYGGGIGYGFPVDTSGGNGLLSDGSAAGGAPDSTINVKLTAPASPPGRHPKHKPKPKKITTIKTTKINPPGKHNTTVKTVKTVRTVGGTKHKKKHK